MTVEVGGVWVLGAVEKDTPEWISLSEEGDENEIEPPLGILEVGQRVKKLVKKCERVPKKKWLSGKEAVARESAMRIMRKKFK